MKKIELLLPAGNEDCLRAAVNNGADAVYLGLSRFNARRSAGNFTKDNIFSVIDYCHKRDVKVYMTFNTLVKNSEIKDFLNDMSIAYASKADAIIIQDSCLIPMIKKNFPGISIHLSTQSTATNSFSIPEGIDRVILPRELSLDEARDISKKSETEVFVHGALCFSYSGQCLFSSIIGGRSGNRGLCAQPCRRKYNNSFLLSTMDLCMLEKIPELVRIGVSSLKVEGRMRSPLYVATVARIYRKYLDSYYKSRFEIDPKDIEDLKIVFSREFTTGFAFNRSIVDSRMPSNRGLYIGLLKEGRLKLNSTLKVGDGIAFFIDGKMKGQRLSKIIKGDSQVDEAFAGDLIDLNIKGLPEKCSVYKTSSVDLVLRLGEEIPHLKPDFQKHDVIVPSFDARPNQDSDKIIVRAYSKKSALEADKAKADIIYYDVFSKDFDEIRKKLRHSKLFAFTPKIISDKQAIELSEFIKGLNPEGILIRNKGLLNILLSKGFIDERNMHLDYSFNCFNDIDISCFKGIPMISPELSLKEIIDLKDKNIIVLVHGDIILVTSKEQIKAPELVDEDNRHFKVRQDHDTIEILNSIPLGLFNRVKLLREQGIRYFYIDTNKDVGKFVRIYKKIIKGDLFDDAKIRKGFTTGHLERGVL